MIVRGVMLMTFLLLGLSWYELSGGSDFVPGDRGVRIMAEVKPAPAPARAPGSSFTVLKPEPQPVPVSQPRVSSLQTRDPLPSRTVRVPQTQAADVDPVAAPAPANADPAVDDIALALAEALEANDAPLSADPADPGDEITAALGDALGDGVVAESAFPAEGGDPLAPAPQIAGLGSAVPLGAPIVGGETIIVAPDALDLRIVTGTKVNLRDGPSTAFDVLTQLFEGDEVEILDDTGDGWVKLQVLNTDVIGWMSDDFLGPAN